MAGSGAGLPPLRGEGRGGGPLHVRRARELRNAATPFEKKLWSLLRETRRSRGLHFRRQVPIGPYIADFACHDRKLIIEIDGHTHDEAYDGRRDAWLAAQGYRTIRLSNWQVANDWDDVVRMLEIELGLCSGG